MKQFFSSLILLVGFFCGLLHAAAVPNPYNGHGLVSNVTERDIAVQRRASGGRLINVSGWMQIKDDEPFSDDYFTHTTSFPAFHVSSGVPTVYKQWVVRAGGEIRVELDLTFNYQAGTEAIKVDYKTRLYEGTSENTGDLDGSISGSATVSRNANRQIAFTVHNTAEGGDWAQISLNVFNGNL